MAEQELDTNYVTITINSKEYNINTKKIPYFNSQLSSSSGEIENFGVALQCVEEGFHSAFGSFKTDISSYPALFATLEHLGVDVLGSRSLDQIIDASKSFKSWNDDKSKTESTNLAEDSVFRLLYMHHTGALRPGDRCKVFNVVTYIISHRYLYNHFTRSVVREIYKTMDPTEKQLTIIAKWPVYDSDGRPHSPYVAPESEDDCYDNYSDSESEAYFLANGHY